MSYTKGPWRREDWAIVSQNETPVAWAAWHNDSTAGLVIDPADEALILGAPSLLEAAQQVLGTQPQRDNETAFGALREAVRQALGDTP